MGSTKGKPIRGAPMQLISYIHDAHANTTQVQNNKPTEQENTITNNYITNYTKLQLTKIRQVQRLAISKNISYRLSELAGSR